MSSPEFAAIDADPAYDYADTLDAAMTRQLLKTVRPDMPYRILTYSVSEAGRAAKLTRVQTLAALRVMIELGDVSDAYGKGGAWTRYGFTHRAAALRTSGHQAGVYP